MEVKLLKGFLRGEIEKILKKNKDMNTLHKKTELEEILGITLQRNGERFEYDGNIYLHHKDITSLPDNLTVEGNLYLCNTKIISLPDNLTVGGYLDLRYSKIKSLPDNLTVGGDLDLRNTDITSLPDNLIVGGYLDIRNTNITSLPNNLTVGGFLNLSNTDITFLPNNLTAKDSIYICNTKITSLPDNLIVGGWLDIHGTGIKSLPDTLIVEESLNIHGTDITQIPDNLIVGGNLDLYNTNITSLPDNLTVGGSLDIRDTKIKSLPGNLTVKGDLNLYATGIEHFPDDLTVGGHIYDNDGRTLKGRNFNNKDVNFLSWQNGKYIKVDGIFSEVVSHKGNVYRVKKIGNDKIFYVVTDGNGKWSHGKTLKEAKRDLIYKISNTDKSKYESYDLDTGVSFEEAIAMYRVITGACSFGVKKFVEENPHKIKKKYKVSEIISITEGEYGHEAFRRFFKR